MKFPNPAKAGCDAVGMSAGILALVAVPFKMVIAIQPAWLLPIIIFPSMVAGVGGGVVAVLNERPPHKAVRNGAWAALAAALTAGSLLIFAIKSIPGADGGRICLGAGLSLLPAMFYGMLAAGVAVLTLGKATTLVTDRPAHKTLLPGVFWGLAGLLFAIALAVPSASIPSSRPSPKVTASTPSQSSPISLWPAPPPFSYSAPVGIVTAHALQLKPKGIHSISDISQGVALISRDDKWMASMSTEPNVLKLVELNIPSNIKLIPLPTSVEQLAFSPSSDRLFAVMSDAEKSFAIIDVASRDFIALPKPKNRTLASGAVFWWRDKEVLFAPDSTQRKILNLDILEVDSADDVPDWKDTSAAEKQRLDSLLRGELPKNSRFELKPAPLIVSTQVSDAENSGHWLVKQTPHLALFHPEFDSCRTLRNIGLEPGDKVLCTQDGSKAVRFRNNAAQIFYFELETTVSLKWNVTMPHPPTDAPRADRIKDALQSGSLSALVYEPLINPLNSKIVGPDRQKVKAVVKFADWKETAGVIYISEFYSQCKAGDVIADICLDSPTKSDPVALKTPHRWWAQLSTPVTGGDSISSLPTLSKLEKQATSTKEVSESSRKAKQEAEIAARKAEQTKLASQERSRTELKSASSMGTLQASNGFQLPTDADFTKREIRQFVQKHHQKAVAGDVMGMVKDYAQTVDHFGNGLKDRAWILKDELAYHSNHTVLEETIDGGVRVDQLAGQSGYTVTYLLRVRTVDKATNRLGGGTFEVNLIIANSPDGYQIVRQRQERKF